MAEHIGQRCPALPAKQINDGSAQRCQHLWRVAAIALSGSSDYLHISRSTLCYYQSVAARLKQVAEG
jgi:hypothetical protein